jgi:AefR-like transcriptional repressor, C-terminal domain/Bacterial regulatory proteins, tetR family
LRTISPLRNPIESTTRESRKQAPANPKRTRVLQAAFSAFQELGYAGASTLEIATRAKVSKRELYTLFFEQAGYARNSHRWTDQTNALPLGVTRFTGPQAVAAKLTAFGTTILRGVCDPSALAVFRLAIAESESSPEVARALDTLVGKPIAQHLSNF